MIMNGDIQVELRDTLVEAFPNQTAFEKVLFRLGTSIAEITSDKNDIVTIIQNAIKVMASQDAIPKLIEAAHFENHKNARLNRFIAEHPSPVNLNLEEKVSTVAIINDRTVPPEASAPAINSGYINPVQYRSNLAAIERQVCWIEIPLRNSRDRSITGTGFLVGPNLILTCYHVVECIFDAETGSGLGRDWAKPEDVIVRFDYILQPNEHVLSKGVECGLAKDGWCKRFSKDSSMDHLAEKPRPPRGNELDYALLKLDREVGSEPVSNLLGAPIRGWIELTQITYSYVSGQPMILLHYPKSGYLKMTPREKASFVRLNENRTRMVYQAVTDPGSSGAPCFDENWTLIGIHRGELCGFEKMYKEGIPIAAIVAHQNKPPPETRIAETLAQIQTNYPDLRMFSILNKNAAGRVSAQEIAMLAEWLDCILPHLTTMQDRAFTCQLLCMDQYFQLTGALNMNKKFKAEIPEDYPAGISDTPVLLRVAAEQVNKIVASIYDKSEVFVRSKDLSKFEETREATINEIVDLEDRIDFIKKGLQMFGFLFSEDGQPLPQDKMDDSLKHLRNQLEGSIRKIAPDYIPIEVRSEIKTHIDLLNDQSPEYHEWLFGLAKKIEEAKKMHFYLN